MANTTELSEIQTMVSDLIAEHGADLLDNLLNEIENDNDLADQDGDIYANDRVTEDEDEDGSTIYVLTEPDDPHTVVADAWRAGRDAVKDRLCELIDAAKAVN